MSAQELLGDVEEILRRPGAKELYLATKGEAWIDPFLSCKNPVYRRLGSQLLIQDLVTKLDPGRAAVAAAEDATIARRVRREAGRKRAAALWMAGATLEDVALYLKITKSVARDWIRKGREL